MGIAIRTGSPLALDIAPPMWKLLVGLPLSLEDLTEVDKDYVTGTCWEGETLLVRVGREKRYRYLLPLSDPYYHGNREV